MSDVVNDRRQLLSEALEDLAADLTNQSQRLVVLQTIQELADALKSSADPFRDIQLLSLGTLAQMMVDLPAMIRVHGQNQMVETLLANAEVLSAPLNF